MGDRINQFDFAQALQSGTRKFVRKAWWTATAQCDFVPVNEPNLRRLCMDLTSSIAFDAIVLSTLLLRDLPLPGRTPIIADTHNVEFDVLKRTYECAGSFLRRQYARRQACATFRAERKCASNVDLLLATSNRDGRIFGQELGANVVEVIPNGVDIQEFAPEENIGEPGAILFTGLMSYYPNQHAIRWFLDSVFPVVLKEVSYAKLIVAGAYPPSWLLAKRAASVEVAGAVPDMRPYFKRARVVIAPLMIGGGTRVKILEAQAMRRPVVSTSIGAEGLNTVDGDSILIANDSATFAGKILRLLADDDLARRIAYRARTHVVSGYDWNRIGEQLESVLRSRIGLVPLNGLKRFPQSERVPARDSGEQPNTGTGDSMSLPIAARGH
jgi:glycosyltransferase involved in cell wall biosynthesis